MQDQGPHLGPQINLLVKTRLEMLFILHIYIFFSSWRGLETQREVPRSGWRVGKAPREGATVTGASRDASGCREPACGQETTAEHHPLPECTANRSQGTHKETCNPLLKTIMNSSIITTDTGATDFLLHIRKNIIAAREGNPGCRVKEVLCKPCTPNTHFPY